MIIHFKTKYCPYRHCLQPVENRGDYCHHHREKITKKATLPNPVKQSFNKNLLIRNWMTDEEIKEVKELVGWMRLGLRKFPGEPYIFRQMREIKSSMPLQGEQVLTLRRFSEESK